MDKNFTVLSLKKYHTFDQLKEQQLHNNRDIKMPHIDYNATILNRNLINGDLDYSIVWKNRLKQAEAQYNHKIKVRRNAVIAMELVLSFSNEQTSNISIDEWCDENVEWLKKTFGEENILAATLHMDEATPHIHAEIIPIDERGHLCAKTFSAGRKAMSDMHESYAKEVGHKFGLIRGKKYTKSKKQDLNDFYKSINQIANTPLPQQQLNESTEEYLKRLEKYLHDLKYGFLRDQMLIEQMQNNYNADLFNEFLEYQEGIDLQQELIDQYEDPKFAMNRINDYRLLEKTVPKNVLEKIIVQLKEKYPIGENVLAFIPERRTKIKKKQNTKPVNTDEINI